MSATSTIVRTKQQFDALTKGMVPIQAVVFSNASPHITIVLYADEPKYTDFINVCRQDKRMRLQSDYKYVYYSGVLYLFCEWNFVRPAHLNVKFYFRCDEFMEMWDEMSKRDYIALTFSDVEIDDETLDFACVTVPSVPKHIVLFTMHLTSTQTMIQENSTFKEIIAEMVK